MIELALQATVEVVCGVTGHALLWAVTLGRWDVANGRDTVAAVVGVLFWVVVGVVIRLVFFR